MSIDHSQPEVLFPARPCFFKPSHRTRPEQVVGLSMFLLVSLATEALLRWILSFTFPGPWFLALDQAPWAMKNWPASSLWTGYHILLSLAMWTLWRRYSLRKLKLELSLFITQFALQTFWTLSFFLLQETLLALIALLLLLSNTLLSSLLFWKKERLSGQLLILPLVWIFYLMGINMVICISNP